MIKKHFLLFTMIVLLTAAITFTACGNGKTEESSTPVAEESSANYPNEGYKKIEPGNQIVEMKVSVTNPGEKKIGVRRMDFVLNGAEEDPLLGKSQDAVVLYAEPQQTISFKSLYQIPETITELKDIEVVYVSVDENYAKIRINIPVIAENPVEKTQ